MDDDQIDSQRTTNTTGNLIGMAVCLVIGLPAYLIYVLFYR